VLASFEDMFYNVLYSKELLCVRALKCGMFQVITAVTWIRKSTSSIKLQIDRLAWRSTGPFDDHRDHWAKIGADGGAKVSKNRCIWILRL
jgi:hypothetical protein